MGINKNEQKTNAVPIQCYVPKVLHRKLKRHCMDRDITIREWLATNLGAAIDALPKGGK